MILAIDTSSLNTTVALIDGEKILGFKDQYEETHQQSKLIFQLIESLLKERAIGPDDVTGVAIGIGPGSYTGLRVGLSLVKTWAFAKSIPVYQFSSRAISERGERLSLQRLLKTDLKAVDRLENLKPVYEKDHFA